MGKRPFQVICNKVIPDDIPIHGTGSCFQDTMPLLLWMRRRYSFEEVDKHAFVCHGIINTYNMGAMTHSWIEYKDTAYELGLADGETVIVRWTSEIPEHYKRPRYLARYNMLELQKNILTSGDWDGPWDPVVIAKLLTEGRD